MSHSPNLGSLAACDRTLGSCNPKLSAVIPFFNEEKCVEAVVQELRETLGALGHSYEAILVDDGSTDRTLELASRAAEAWPQGTVVATSRNRGQAAALLTGFSRSRGDVLITLDGDGQNNPADLSGLLDRLGSGDADMVVGVRIDRQDSGLRRTMSSVANAVRQRVLRDGVSDTGCALKVFRREVLSAFIPIRTLYSFMPALAIAAGFRVVELPVNHRPRIAGTSKYGLLSMAWRPIVDMIGVGWFARRRIEGEVK